MALGIMSKVFKTVLDSRPLIGQISSNFRPISIILKPIRSQTIFWRMLGSSKFGIGNRLRYEINDLTKINAA